ncbi:MAG: nucleotidyltransferase family protein [Oscillospiraceae bacterium]|nr:nucleotidyltransferase family protein [Oscillospiraceae bacterium]
MPVIAIVSEYNPFHNGHLYQIQKIKEIFPDSVIISIMSGSLVQRGEPALFSKYNRAEIAVRNGVDAVFELSSVYSNSPANIFAFSAVYIMQKLSGIDYICFGSECGDLELLDFAAEKIMSEEFDLKLRENIKANKNKSYPQNVYDLFREIYGEEKAEVLNGSNNILAVEYLKALKKLNSNIMPFTIKRIGADFNSQKETVDETYVSAGYLRKLIRENNISEIKNFMPEQAYEISLKLIKSWKFTDINNLSPAIISHLNRIDVHEIAKCAEVFGGEEHRIKKLLDGCFDYDSIIKNLEAKHNTSSSVKRMILNIFFGITKKMQNNPTDFTVVLGLNEKGKIFLNNIRKKTQIKIITKPADMKNNKSFGKNLFIDNVCKLALFNKYDEINQIKQKPFIKNL